jgi:hypothetical protein
LRTRCSVFDALLVRMWKLLLNSLTESSRCADASA